MQGQAFKRQWIRLLNTNSDIKKNPVDFYLNYEAPWTFLEIASTVENHSSSLSRWLFQYVNIYFRTVLFEMGPRGKMGEKSALSVLNSVYLDCKVALSLTPWTLCFVFTKISAEYAYFLTKNMLISSQRTYLWWSFHTLYLLACQVGESYCRQFRSPLCWCNICWVLLTPLVCC